jgi:uroporphyrinogen decarboxylase
MRDFGAPPPDFEHFRNVLFMREYERVPLVDFWCDDAFPEAVLGITNPAQKDFIAFRSICGYDFHFYNMCLFTPEEEAAGRYHFDSQPRITGPEDLRTFRWPSVTDVVFEEIDSCATYLPRTMKVVLGFNAVNQTTWELLGFKRYFYGSAQNPSFVEEIMRRIGETYLHVIERIPEHPAIGAVILADDMAYRTGTMMRPEFLRKNVFSWYKEFADILKPHDVPLIFHSDGNLFGVLETIMNCGAAALHPIEPDAMNITEVKKRVGDRLCLLGHVDVSGTLSLGTPDEVRSECMRIMSEMAPLGGYCCGSSNSLSSGIPFENFAAMVTAVHDFNRQRIGPRSRDT